MYRANFLPGAVPVKFILNENLKIEQSAQVGEAQKYKL